MATQTLNMAPEVTSDAMWRTKMQSISDALTTLGLPKSADTGQINFVTATKPTAAATSGGYEIRKFDDTLQATAPVFFRVEYMTGNLATAYGIQISVGTGTDGAGALTGKFTVAHWVTYATSASSTASDNFLSGANNRLNMFWQSGATTSGLGMGAFHLERTKNPDGTDNSDGVIVGWNAYTFLQAEVCLNFNTVAQPALISGGGAPLSFTHELNNTTGLFGGDVTIYPIYGYLGGKLTLPCLNRVTYLRDDQSAGNVFTVNHYGATRTYRAWGSVAPTSPYYPARGPTGASQYSRTAMRWE